MSPFQLYLKLGLEHIADFAAYDHMLFILALSVPYQFKNWRLVAGLVTAFTIGHSITLALSTLNYVLIPSEIIEFLIPLSIFITALSNLIFFKPNKQPSIARQYSFALFFGLIHGMGFSNYLKSLLGSENSIIQPLFAFNIGLELGQLLIVFAFLCLTFLFVKLFKLPFKAWFWSVSLITLILSVYLMIQTKFW